MQLVLEFIVYGEDVVEDDGGGGGVTGSEEDGVKPLPYVVPLL